MDKLFALFMTAFLIDNIILSKFLGMCPFLGVSRNRGSAIGMGLAVIFVILGASIFTWILYYAVLKPAKLEYMDLITFILVIAAFVQFVEMFLKKYSNSLYKSLGIYLPLITTNCVVLYVTLQNITNGFNFVEMIVYSIAVPAGFALMLFIFSTIRERLDIATTPKPFRGNAIALVLAAIMALAFSGLAGLV
jgi:electron transport complex protein RnfA